MVHPVNLWGEAARLRGVGRVPTCYFVFTVYILYAQYNTKAAPVKRGGKIFMRL